VATLYRTKPPHLPDSTILSI